MKQILGLLALAVLFSSAEGCSFDENSAGEYNICKNRAGNVEDRDAEFAFNGEHYKTLTEAEAAWTEHFSRALGLVVSEENPADNEIATIAALLYTLQDFTPSKIANSQLENLAELDSEIFSTLSKGIKEAFVDYKMAEVEGNSEKVTLIPPTSVPTIEDFLKKSLQ